MEVVIEFFVENLKKEVLNLEKRMYSKIYLNLKKTLKTIEIKQ